MYLFAWLFYLAIASGVQGYSWFLSQELLLVGCWESTRIRCSQSTRAPLFSLYVGKQWMGIRHLELYLDPEWSYGPRFQGLGPVWFLETYLLETIHWYIGGSPHHHGKQKYMLCGSRAMLPRSVTLLRSDGGNTCPLNFVPLAVLLLCWERCLQVLRTQLVLCSPLKLWPAHPRHILVSQPSYSLSGNLIETVYFWLSFLSSRAIYQN